MKISVITPSFNSARYLEKAIKSVEMQEYRNWEHIIVDGGSNDQTVEILEKYPHIKWISEPDQGQSDAMNKGFQMSTGSIIVYLNADDFFSGDVFKYVHEAFTGDINMLFGNIRLQSPQENRIVKPSFRYQEIINYWNCTFPINPVGYFYRRKVQENYFFNIDNHFTMDLEFLFYATKFFPEASYINRTFGTFRLDGSNKTSTMDLELEKSRAYINHCRRYNKIRYLKYHVGKHLRKK